MAMAMITATAMVEKMPSNARKYLRQGRGRHSSRLSATSLWRALIIFGPALAVGWLSASHAVASISANKSPDLALRFVPDHPAALAKKAEREFRRGNEAEAEVLAKKSIRSSATSSGGFQVLGLIDGANSSSAEADRFFSYALRLNRREVPAQIWLFRRRLAEGDVASALSHVDGAMRVSARSRATLYPLLAAAMASDGLLPSVTAMMAKNPVWLIDFVHYAISKNASLIPLARSLASLPKSSPARAVELQAKVIQRLAESGKFSVAEEFMYAVEASPVKSLVRDPMFTTNGPYAPFDWQYVNDPRLNSSPLPGAEPGLAFAAASGEGGGIVRQLITLRPGAYRLESTGRMLSGHDGGVIWKVTCANAVSPDVIAQMPMHNETTDQFRRVDAGFMVPSSGCPAQWLELTVQASFAPKGVTGEVNSVSIERVRHERRRVNTDDSGHREWKDAQSRKLEALQVAARATS